MATLLEKIKESMRIKHNAIDGSLLDDIDAGTLDLIRTGVQPYQKDENGDYVLESEKKVLKDDALISKAIELYCKYQEDFQGNAERYEKAYEKLRDSLSLCGDYIE